MREILINTSYLSWCNFKYILIYPFLVMIWIIYGNICIFECQILIEGKLCKELHMRPQMKWWLEFHNCLGADYIEKSLSTRILGFGVERKRIPQIWEMTLNCPHFVNFYSHGRSNGSSELSQSRPQNGIRKENKK